jgi:hypothetical protein
MRFLACALGLAALAGANASEPSYLIQASASFQRLGVYWISDDATYARERSRRSDPQVPVTS